MTVESAEDRLQRLEDRDAIHQLFVDYGRHLDQGNWERLAALFAEDGEVLLGPMGRAKGPEAIQELMARTLTAGLGTSFHIISSPDVTLAGDTATAEVMWTVVERRPDGGLGISLLGRHLDRLSRTPEGWRIQRRKGDLHLVAKPPAAGAAQPSSSGP
ncbi:MULTISPECIES: nuclear transport factor 2 family protein [Frankia]|uniref:nuclear transport factor 2 family protein n=1 Tax=Frankia TaxID=1854 RepID=UPI001E2C0561|nr:MULTISPECIES: nuclear transport factor 2 family protein [Frankia]